MKIFQGIVKSAKNKNTAVVEVERFYVHPLYEKRVKRTKGYAVHIETDVKVGDRVKFVETRPISKTKRWKLIEDEKPVKSETRQERDSPKAAKKVKRVVKTKKKGTK